MKFKEPLVVVASILLLPATFAKVIDREMSTFDAFQFPAFSEGGLAPQREIRPTQTEAGVTDITIESLAQLAREMPFESYRNYINNLAGRGILGFDIVPQFLAMAQIPSP